MDGRLVSYEESPDSPDEWLSDNDTEDSATKCAADDATPQPDAALCSDAMPEVPCGSDEEPAVVQEVISGASMGSGAAEKSVLSSEDHTICMASLGPGRLSEEEKQKMEEMRIRTGNDPDCAEFEQLRLPDWTKVNSDLIHLKCKYVLAYLLTMEELSHPNVLEVMAHCQEFKVEFVQQPELTTTPFRWKGCVVFRMHTLADARGSVLLLRDIRTDLQVRILKPGENSYEVMSSWRQNIPVPPHEDSKETDHMLVINNLAPGTTEEILENLFPDALEIVIPGKRRSHKRKSSNPVEAPPESFAYLKYGTRCQMEEAYEKYTSKIINYDGHMLRILKYEFPKDIPSDYLRLRERFQVLSLLQLLINADALGVTAQYSPRVKQAVSDMSKLVAADAEARTSLALPVFCLEELYELLAVSKPPDSPETVPVADLLTAFSELGEALSASKTTRRSHQGSSAKDFAIKAESSDSDSGRTAQSLSHAEGSQDKPTSSRVHRALESMVHSRSSQSRLPYGARFTENHTSTLRKRSADSDASALYRKRFHPSDMYRGRGGGPSRYEMTRSGSYIYQRKNHYLRNKGLSSYCTKSRPGVVFRDHGSRYIHPRYGRH